MSDEPRFDVVIYNYSTREIASIAGKNLLLDTGTHNAIKRKASCYEHINSDYGVNIVPTGKYQKGDKLTDEGDPQCQTTES